MIRFLSILLFISWNIRFVCIVRVKYVDDLIVLIG